MLFYNFIGLIFFFSIFVDVNGTKIDELCFGYRIKSFAIALKLYFISFSSENKRGLQVLIINETTPQTPQNNSSLKKLI